MRRSLQGQHQREDPPLLAWTCAAGAVAAHADLWCCLTAGWPSSRATSTYAAASQTQTVMLTERWVGGWVCSAGCGGRAKGAKEHPPAVRSQPHVLLLTCKPCPRWQLVSGMQRAACSAPAVSCFVAMARGGGGGPGPTSHRCALHASWYLHSCGTGGQLLNKIPHAGGGAANRLFVRVALPHIMPPPVSPPLPPDPSCCCLLLHSPPASPSQGASSTGRMSTSGAAWPAPYPPTAMMPLPWVTKHQTGAPAPMQRSCGSRRCSGRWPTRCKT